MPMHYAFLPYGQAQFVTVAGNTITAQLNIVDVTGTTRTFSNGNLAYGQSCRISNDGAGPIYVQFGGTATLSATSGTSVQPASGAGPSFFTVSGFTNVTIRSAVTGTVNITVGEGGQ